MHTVQQKLDPGRWNYQNSVHDEMKASRAEHSCDWVFEETAVHDWLLGTCQFLALYGAMGSGKSVVSSFVVDELCARQKTGLPKPFVVYYYFRDDQDHGGPAGIYCTLYRQLVEQLGGEEQITLKKWFQKWYESRRIWSNPLARYEDYMAVFFLDTVKRLQLPLYVVLDGLDTCHPRDLAALMDLMRTLCSEMEGLRVMLSSRPYQDITNDVFDTLKIHIPSNFERDRMIAQHHITRQLPSLSTPCSELLLKFISTNARGIAIWTSIIVVHIRNREIKDVDLLTKELEGFPARNDLAKMYLRLFDQSALDNQENIQFLTTALQILAAAGQPITVSELAKATTIKFIPGVITPERLERHLDIGRIRSLVEPLVTMTNADGVLEGNEVVRLVHHSLRALLLEAPPKQWGDMPAHREPMHRYDINPATTS